MALTRGKPDDKGASRPVLKLHCFPARTCFFWHTTGTGTSCTLTSSAPGLGTSCHWQCAVFLAKCALNL
jgi:hypothetical protein